jgi:hypothetical protein
MLKMSYPPSSQTNGCRTGSDIRLRREFLSIRKPRSTTVALRGHSLRESLKNSNFVLLKIPVEIHNLGHGQRLICMESDRLRQESGLNEEAIGCLVQAGLVRLRPQKLRPKPRIDYAALQQTYARMLTDGGFATQADLPRHLGVSRAWVSRVLK